MQHTYTAVTMLTLQDMGFIFTKDKDGYWLFCDGENVLESGRVLGDLVARIAKQLGI